MSRQDTAGASMDEINVRYMVDDVAAAVTFYTNYLGFKVTLDASPAFAAVTRGNLKLLLSGRKSGAGTPMSDGTLPVPGGWNRFLVIVDDLEAEVEKLKAKGLHFRNAIITGPGGSEVLLVDPSGNFVELFQPAKK